MSHGREPPREFAEPAPQRTYLPSPKKTPYPPWIARSVRNANAWILGNYDKQQQLKLDIQYQDNLEISFKELTPDTRDFLRQGIGSSMDIFQDELMRLKNMIDDFIDAYACNNPHRLLDYADSQTTALDELDIAVLDVIAELDFVCPRRQAFLDSIPHKYRVIGDGPYQARWEENSKKYSEARLAELKCKTRRINEATEMGRRPEEIPYTTFEDWSLLANPPPEPRAGNLTQKNAVMRRKLVTMQTESIRKELEHAASPVAVDDERSPQSDKVLIEAHLIKLRKKNAKMNKEWKAWNVKRIKSNAEMGGSERIRKEALQVMSEMEEEEELESRVARIRRIMDCMPKIFEVPKFVPSK